MQTASVSIPWAPRIRIVFVGDAHIGAAGCREGLLRDTVGAVLADEHSYLIELGDAIDAINMADKRFDPRALAEWVQVGDLADLGRAETERYASIMRPARQRILAHLKGNHEAVLSRRFERDVYRGLTEAVGVPEARRIGTGGFLRLRIADSYKGRKGSRKAWGLNLFLHHGATGGALAGAKALALERLPMAFRADVYALGHSHTKLGLLKEVVTPDGPQQIALVNTGSFLDGYRDGASSYAEAKLLYPQGLGPVEVWLYPEERLMRVVM